MLTELVYGFQVVVDQNVLIKASPDLTMAEATSIADNTLQYTVRSTLWALRAPEILMVCNGMSSSVRNQMHVSPYTMLHALDIPLQSALYE